MSLLTNNIWLGDLPSFDIISRVEDQVYKKMEKALDAGEKFSMFAGYGNHDEDDEEPEYQIVDGIAIIPVRGTLITNETWLTKLFGMTSYEGLRRLLHDASQNESVERIVLDFNTPGGNSEGVDEAGLFIKKIDSEIKPVHAFTSGSMNSAGYWLGAACRDITCTKMAQLGSIGVVTIHEEMSKQLKDRGIEVTVFRDGKYKAKPNSFEKLSAEDKKMINGSLKILGNMFLDWVADERGFERGSVRSDVGEGRVFFGTEAVENGLADRNLFFEDFLNKLIKLSTLDSTPVQSQYAGMTVVPSTFTLEILPTISEKTLQVITAGVESSLTDSILIKPDGDTSMSVVNKKTSSTGIKFQTEDGKEMTLSLEQVEAAVELGDITMTAELKKAIDDHKTQLAAEEDGVSDTAENKGEGEEGAGSSSMSSDDNSDTGDDNPVVAHLQTQLTEQVSTNTKLQLEIVTLKGKLESTEDSTKALTQIAMTSCQKMTVALGGTPMELSDMSVVDLLNHHTKISEQFTASFKVNGVAVANNDEENSDEGKNEFLAPLATVKL